MGRTYEGSTSGKNRKSRYCIICLQLGIITIFSCTAVGALGPCKYLQKVSLHLIQHFIREGFTQKMRRYLPTIGWIHHYNLSYTSGSTDNVTCNAAVFMSMELLDISLVSLHTFPQFCSFTVFHNLLRSCVHSSTWRVFAEFIYWKPNRKSILYYRAY